MRKLIIFAVALLLFSCAIPGEKQEVQGVSSNFKIEKLFTIEGATIYRFMDAGHYRYFLLGDGRMTNQTTTQSAGKGTSSHDDGVIK